METPLGVSASGSGLALDPVRVEMKDKSISRCHLTIDIGPVKSGDGMKLHARPPVYFTDKVSSKGTRVNGREIKGLDAVAPDGDEVILHLGKYTSAFRLTWTPIVLSISMSSKEKKDKSVMGAYQSLVEQFCVKTIHAYTPETTHAVASKRNTAIGLQALINQKRIVTKSYLEAIAEAATGSAGQLAPLEMDFDANWPPEHKFLPPPAKEVPRPPEIYAPDLVRQSLFENWIFIFFEKAQYDALLGPITDAGGKLELYALELNKTTPKDVAEFARKRTKAGDFVLVRFRGGTDPDVEHGLVAGIEELVGFKMFEQNRFIDVILTCDTSLLHERIDYSISSTAATLEASRTRTDGPEPTPTPAFTQDRTQPEEPGKAIQELHFSTPTAELAPAPAPRRRARTRQPIVLANPFVIELDDLPVAPSMPRPTQSQAQRNPKTSPTHPIAVECEETQPTIASHPRPEAQRVPDAIGTATMADEADVVPSSIPETQAAASDQPQKKRRAALPEPEPDRDQDLDVMDMLPNAKIVKRRKLVEAAEHERRGGTDTPMPEAIPAEPLVEETLQTEQKSKGRGTKKQPDEFTAKARAIRAREAEEEEKAKQAEAEALEGIDINDLKNLAIVDVMEVKPRKARAADSAGNKWDVKWDGRKNFKKFRRNGTGRAPKSVRNTVMINLVPYKGRDYGIGDGYWLDEGEDGEKATATRNPTPKQVSQHRQPAANRPHAVSPEIQGQSQSQTVQAESASATQGTKRAATLQTRTAAPKRQRMLQIRSDSASEDSDEDSDEDDLKFRFRSKRR